MVRAPCFLKQHHGRPHRGVEPRPPEILRYLIASTKPAKAIEFDGMGLVNLADAYERLLRRTSSQAGGRGTRRSASPSKTTSQQRGCLP